MFNTGRSEEIRLRKQNEITTAIKHLIVKDPEETATALMNALIAVMAKVYPAQLDRDAEAKIRDNYPSANATLMAERAMSRAGVLLTVSRGLHCALIALDYSPDSHGKPYVDSDVKLPKQMSNFRGQCAELFAAGLASGISPLGVGTLMTLMAADCAGDQGIDTFAMLKSMVDVSLTLVERESDPMLTDPGKSSRVAIVNDTVSAIVKDQTKH